MYNYAFKLTINYKNIVNKNNFYKTSLEYHTKIKNICNVN